MLISVRSIANNWSQIIKPGRVRLHQLYRCQTGAQGSPMKFHNLPPTLSESASYLPTNHKGILEPWTKA